MTSLSGDGQRAPMMLGHSADDSFLLGHPEKPFRKRFKGGIATVTTTMIQIAAMIFVEVIAFNPDLIPSMFSGGPHLFRNFAMLHSCIWILTALIAWQSLLSHRRSRFKGYLTFHRRSRILRKTPLYLLSLGSMMLLVISVVWEDDESKRVLAFRCIYSFELFLCLSMSLAYLGLVLQFNRQAELPDVFHELVSQVHTNDTHKYFHVDNDLEDVQDVVEKQADIIRFVKQHNEGLTKTIRLLTEQLQRFERGA